MKELIIKARIIPLGLRDLKIKIYLTKKVIIAIISRLNITEAKYIPFDYIFRRHS